MKLLIHKRETQRTFPSPMLKPRAALEGWDFHTTVTDTL